MCRHPRGSPQPGRCARRGRQPVGRLHVWWPQGCFPLVLQPVCPHGRGGGGSACAEPPVWLLRTHCSPHRPRIHRKLPWGGLGRGPSCVHRLCPSVPVSVSIRLSLCPSESIRPCVCPSVSVCVHLSVGPCVLRACAPYPQGCVTEGDHTRWDLGWDLPFHHHAVSTAGHSQGGGVSGLCADDPGPPGCRVNGNDPGTAVCTTQRVPYTRYRAT